jgi:hypothetical protein
MLIIENRSYVNDNLYYREDTLMDAAKKLVLLAVALFLCAVAPLAGQASADIFGVVQMKDGAMLPGVHVTATSLSLAGTAIEVTDNNGSFRLSSLAPGVYKLTFDLEGFRTVTRERVPLGLEQSVDLRVIMKRGKRKAAGTMTGLSALLAVKRAANSKTLTREVFQTLPKGREFDSLASLAPGFADEPLLLDGISVDGASGLENKFYIDGVDVTDIRDGSLGQGIAFDFVDEVQFQASGAQAESAGAMGGVISVVTRSGGNELHGEVIGYYSGAPLRARHPDILALDPQDRSKAVYQPYEYFYGDNDDQRIEAGFNLGGAILKNKLWFFGSFLPVFNTNTRILDWYQGEFPRTERQMNFLLKLAAQPFRNLRLSAGVINLFHKYKGDLPSRGQDLDPYISYEDYGFSYPNLSGSFSADLSAGDRFLVSARLGFFRTNQNNPLVKSGDVPYVYFRTEAPGGYFNTTPIGFPDIPPKYWLPPDGGYTGRTRPLITGMEKNVAEKLSLGLDLSCFLDFGGEHSWKAGFSWARRGEDVDNSPTVPILFFAWNHSFPGDYAYAGGDRGKYGYYAVRNNEVTGPYGDYYKAYGNMLALYIQDSWTIADRLTLNIGVRAGSENIPFYTDDPAYANLDAIRFGLGDKLAPRLGFVWDVQGDSSLKVFGSFGIFFDDMKLAMAANVYGGFKWKSTYYALDTYEWDKIGVNGYYPGRLLLAAPYTLDFRAPAFDSTDPDLKPMAQREISLGLEKRLGSDLTFSVRYTGKRLIRAIEDIGLQTSMGQKFYIANPGGAFIRQKFEQARADGALPANAPAPSMAQREYNGVTIALDKRFSGNWQGGVSYTWSRLWGNYSGLASGDTLDRSEPSTEIYFDSWFVSRTLTLEDAVGPLPGDRPHHIKAYGTYSFPFGVSAGLVLHAMSGTPTSTAWTLRTESYGDKKTVMPYGRGDQKRSPFLWYANFYVEYNLKLGKCNLNVNLNIDNVFDIRTAQHLYPVYNQAAVTISEARIAQGSWDIHDYDPELDPRYLMASDFYEPLAARLGLKFGF